MTIVVSGASGMMGRSLCKSLAADGVRVLRLVRRAPASADEVAWCRRSASASAPSSATARRRSPGWCSTTLLPPCASPMPGALLRLAVGELVESLLSAAAVVPTQLLAAGFRFQYPSLAGALEHALG